MKKIIECPFCKQKAMLEIKNELFYCFACKIGGTKESFNLKTPEEVDITVKKEGLQVLKILSMATEYYQNNLKNNKQALEYIQKRGLQEKEVQKYKIGFARSNNTLYSFLKKSFDDDILEKSGLFYKNASGELYDVFRDRIILPIFNTKGIVVSFSGRLITNSKKYPKYVNGINTIVFNKRNTLYCLNFAKKDKPFILCEGHLDAISINRAGFNGIASMGTALSKENIENIKNYTDVIYLGFDNDEAGQTAKEKSMKLLNSYGIKTMDLSYSPYKDADEFIRNEGVEKFKNLL